MQRRMLILALVLTSGLSANNTRAAGDPDQTVRQAEQVLADLSAIPAKSIPHYLLTDATAVAIIPDVTKIGFIAGVRRGHGVVLVRDAEGEWSLPQFITLTGGSVGWQAGVQGTDVVLIFRSRKGVEGLMRGKFTIGVDAAASAGPVGRNAEAATDTALKSEILSYSRSRGLFLGVALDGSALEIDQHAHGRFYGVPTGEVPQRLPESADQLRQYLSELAGTKPETTRDNAGPPTPITPPSQQATPRKLEALRKSLVQNAGQLHAIVSPAWRQYLAVPKELLDPKAEPNLEALTALEQRFTKIEANSSYKDLAARPEFQTTHDVLKEYIRELTPTGPTLQLPPPPVK
jgi:lipid-binding SYLF domain-containing protein